MINDNRSNTGYRTIANVMDGKTRECENFWAYIYYVYMQLRIFNNRHQKKRALNRAYFSWSIYSSIYVFDSDALAFYYQNLLHN